MNKTEKTASIIPSAPLALFDPEPLLAAAALIETTKDLARFLDSVVDSDVFCVDTESAGFFRYHATVNLIQVSTRHRAAIIDPQAMNDFSPFRDFPKRSSCQWVFHGSEYDARELHKFLGLEIPTLFDPRLAAEMAGLDELGMSPLAKRFLGFSLDKKLQRCDWSRRPLTPGMKRYGLLDAICLVPLRDFLTEELRRCGRLEWAEEEFAILAKEARHAVDPEKNPFQFIIKGASRMPPRNLAILKEVWTLREQIAKSINRAPFMVVNNQVLLDIARQAPKSFAGLTTISQLGHEFLLRHGKELQMAIKRGIEGDPVRRPLSTRPEKRFPTLTCWEAELCHALREVRDHFADRLHIAPSMLASSRVMFELACSRPNTIEGMSQIAELRHWQTALLGEEFLGVLKKAQPPAKPPGRRHRRRRTSQPM